ncbi:MAG: carboxypeptidase-like regulatory domain-containing protein [Pyrinomonadaceae bacterium]
MLPLIKLLVFAQGSVRDGTLPQQHNPPGLAEVPDSEELRRFVEEHSYSNPSFRQKQSERADLEAVPLGLVSKQVRIIYLVPSDREARADYQNAIANAISNVQRFYSDQLGGGYGFSLHSPVVEVYRTAHPAAFYSTGVYSGSNGFFSSALTDGFAVTRGGFNDPNNRWIFYIDADPSCGQGIGSNSGAAVLAGNDLRGLTGQTNVPPCSYAQPDTGGVNRWIGGLAHELGHTFNIPHPPGCDGGSCAGGLFTYNSLMWIGYAYYPTTYLLDENKAQLLASGFFNVLSPDPPARYDISGRITKSDNTALGGVTVALSGSQSGSTVTDGNGGYSFPNLPVGGGYSIAPAQTSYTFSPQLQTFNALNGNQAANFTATPDAVVPVLISEGLTTRALAMDSVLRLPEPFPPAYQSSWGTDRGTRITLFATNFELTPNETALAVTAEAEDAAHRIYTLPVEYVGRVPGFNWLSCIVVRLNDSLGDVGDVLVRIRYRGASSNRVRVGVGHVGGGLPDDAGAVPTSVLPPQ